MCILSAGLRGFTRDMLILICGHRYHLRMALCRWPAPGGLKLSLLLGGCCLRVHPSSTPSLTFGGGGMYNFPAALAVEES